MNSTSSGLGTSAYRKRAFVGGGEGEAREGHMNSTSSGLDTSA